MLRRLWPMMLAVCAGTWAGIGLMTGTTAKPGTALLGTALAFYAITGLAAWRLPAPRSWEPILTPLVGAITGLIAAATGVFVIPAVPYLQAIGLEGDELVQALGLSFTISTPALAVNVGLEGGLGVSMTGDTAIALALACAGMWAGQVVRLRLSPSAGGSSRGCYRWVHIWLPAPSADRRVERAPVCAPPRAPGPLCAA